jgi:hypothetical protein
MEQIHCFDGQTLGNEGLLALTARISEVPSQHQAAWMIFTLRAPVLLAGALTVADFIFPDLLGSRGPTPGHLRASPPPPRNLLRAPCVDSVGPAWRPR